MHLNHFIKAGIAIVAFAASVGAQAASHGVTVTLSTDKHMLGKDDDVVMRVTITNTSSTPQYVLKWHTPFDTEIEEGLFDVTRDGVKVPYQGAHYKRPAPTAADYYMLKPGASHTARVELSSMYDMSITGDYVVSYHARSYNLFTSDPGPQGIVSTEKELGEIASAPVSLWIDGRQARGTVATQPQTFAELTAATSGSLSFNKCTATQQSTIAQAVGAAQTMVADGDAYMTAGQMGTRYTKWFGAVDAARVATIKAHYTAIKDALNNKPVTVDCGCKKTYYAYVYPTQPYTIYVCKAFWTAPLTGTDSKGGTLIHETSHFNVVASTDDWVYGQTGAASLAISNPSQAIDNADSHEYFGENTPALQ
ncbi:MAG: M35 family metallo-endopeptidase [Pseudomonadota bacterium]